MFLWDDDAQPRERAALMDNSRTEPARTIPVTPSRRQPSPPLPCANQTRPTTVSKKRNRSISDDLNDEYGFGQSSDDFNGALSHIMTQVETPSKAVKTSNIATPATGRRQLPWQMDQPIAGSSHGLQTPQSERRIPGDPFASRYAAAGASLFTPVKEEKDGSHQTATPSSSFETPTPSRFRNAVAEDVIQDIFGILQEADVRMRVQTENELKSLLSKHAKSAEGYKRGREVLRTTVKARDAKVTELNYRISTLEAELEAERATVKHLQWELQNEAQDP